MAIRRDSVPLLKFLFYSHVQVFSNEIIPIYHLKYSYSHFSSTYYYYCHYHYNYKLISLILSSLMANNLWHFLVLSIISVSKIYDMGKTVIHIKKFKISTKTEKFKLKTKEKKSLKKKKEKKGMWLRRGNQVDEGCLP